MKKDTFQLIYDGEGIHDGEMDASALAPALLAIAELFDAADTTINGSETVVSTRVKAGFRKGSFEVLFSIEQHVIDAAVGILPTLHLIGADLLIATVLGNLKSKIKERIGESASDTVVGLFKLLAHLGGRKPNIEYDQGKAIYVFNTGDNCTFNVDQRTTELYQSRKTMTAASKVASPLIRRGIDKPKIKRHSEEVAVLEGRDFPQIEPPLDLESGLMLANAPDGQPQELIVRVVRFDFEKDKWVVSDGGKPFEAVLEDAEFRASIHSRAVGFFDGDYYRVRMITQQKMDGRGLHTTRRIVNVVEPVKKERQSTFLEND